MIQSSQPSSLKFTCSAFLLHLDLDFFPCLLPCRLLSAVLRRRRGPSPLAPFENTASSSATRMAFSCWGRPSLFSPRCLKSTSMSDLPRVTLSWKQSRDLESSSLPVVCRELCKSPVALLNILNSAPTSSSLSERVETSNRYFCLRRGECKRSSARIKEENNCSQFHLGCTVFRGMQAGRGAHILS
uniref:Uncharacterized protein n=1 Tax=Monopterus albus TaxID=43700 RepID=A0A3Q3IHG4_MONAL